MQTEASDVAVVLAGSGGDVAVGGMSPFDDDGDVEAACLRASSS